MRSVTDAEQLGRVRAPPPSMFKTFRTSLQTSRNRLRTDLLPLSRVRPLFADAVIRQACGMWLATRVAFVIVTYFAVLFNAQRSFAPPSLVPFPPHALAGSWNNWDAVWYTHIATAGYDKASTTAFFPLYPLLIHLVGGFIGQTHVRLAALIVSNLGALVAFVALGLLSAGESDAAEASYTIRAFAAYPFAFFTVAPYSDSLFLALATLSLLFCRRSAWLAAAACAFLAALTRPFGVVLVLPLLFAYGRWYYQVRRQDGSLGLRDIVEGSILVASVPLALGLWIGYLWVHFGDPLVALKAQHLYWGHKVLLPWQTAHVTIDALLRIPPWTFVQARMLMDFAPVAVFALLTVLAARRMPLIFTLYMAGVLGIIVATPFPTYQDPFVSAGRYLLASLPVFLLIGKWIARHPWLDLLVTGGGFMLQGIFTAFFLRAGWIY